MKAVLDFQHSICSGRKLAASALLVVLFFSVTTSAQTNAPKELSSRYLFVVDTSYAMRKRAAATQKAVENLLRSNMSAQLRRGDTLGVWTFNEELFAGRLPLQRWSPENAETVVDSVGAFLKAQRYQNESRFSVALSALERLIKDSDKLTVFLVTGGNERISGTPFDREIRAAIEAGFNQQQKEHMPFVTTLRVRRGRIVNASVSLAPWPVELPAFPPEPKIVEAPKPPPEKKAAPRTNAPPIIIVGKQRLPPGVTNIPPTTTTNAPVPPATNAVAPSAAVTDEPVRKELFSVPTPTLALQTSAADAKPGSTNEAPVNSVKIPEPAPTATPEKKPEQPVAISAETKPPIPTATPPVEPPKPASAQTTTAPTTDHVSGAVAAPETGTTPTPRADSVSSNSATTTLAEATPPAAGFNPLMLVVCGCGVLVVLVAGLFFLWQRRAREAHGSLITRSMERK